MTRFRPLGLLIHLKGCINEALRQLDRMDHDELLAENIDLLVAELLARHLPDEVSIEWALPTRSDPTETTTQVRDRFSGEVRTVPASKIVIRVPISGSAELLNYPSSTTDPFDSPQLGVVSGSWLEVHVVEETLSGEIVRQRIAAATEDMNRRVGWANSDLREAREAAERELRQRYADRRERILNDRALVDDLGIPMNALDAPRPPAVSARRKHVSLETRRSQAKYVPEPVLTEAHYLEVLDIVRSWAASLERTPGTTDKLDEESLRDLLLGTLNGYWEGGAGGELFNGQGKTDILIREGNRNVFIAELKIWRGSKSATAAVDQLLSYLVWRDSKAALIIFIKSAHPADVIEKLHEAVAAHKAWALTKNGGDPNRQIDYVMTADDEDRRVSMAVLPVVITQSPSRT